MKAMKTVFRNVDELIAELSKSKELIKYVRDKAVWEGNAEMLAQAEKLLALFANDAALLREKAKQLAQPDGTIQFGFTQEAWNEFCKMTDASARDTLDR